MQDVIPEILVKTYSARALTRKHAKTANFARMELMDVWMASVIRLAVVLMAKYALSV